jgi:hypothetical protein
MEGYNNVDIIDFIKKAWPYIIAGGGVCTAVLALYKNALESKKAQLEIKNLKKELKNRESIIIRPTQKDTDSGKAT